MNLKDIYKEIKLLESKMCFYHPTRSPTLAKSFCESISRLAGEGKDLQSGVRSAAFTACQEPHLGAAISDTHNKRADI